MLSMLPLFLVVAENALAMSIELMVCANLVLKNQMFGLSIALRIGSVSIMEFNEV